MAIKSRTQKMIRIGIARAKNGLSALVNRVAFGGERVLLESRGKPKAALVSLQDLHQLERVAMEIPTRSQRLLALAEADRVRVALQGRRLIDSTKQLHRLREERARELAKR